MERKRVFEIKKRFEELDKLSARTNGNTSVTKLPVFQTGKINNDFESKRFLKERAWENECDVQNVVKKPLEKTSSLEGSSSGKNVIRRSHAFRSSKNDFTTQKGKSVGQNANDVCRSALPPGPAPKKPPRTFAHKVGDPPSLSNCKMEKTDPQNGKPSFKRSKTEPLIMLKKLESALKIHRSQNGGERSLPVPPSNGNVYDTPYDAHNKAGMSLPVSTFKSSVEPVYSEPCIVKPKPKALTLAPPAPQPSKSLYYMSSPVVDRDVNPRLSKNPTYEEALNKIQMWVLDSDAPRQEADSDVESVREIKPEVVEERKIYAKRVSSLKERAVLKEVRSERLIDALILVGIDNDINNGKMAYIKEKYPASAQVPPGVERLVFPDADNWPPAVHPPLHLTSEDASNNYTLLLTSLDGSRYYAYCRRLQPEGSTVCLPLAYAIITAHKAKSLYYQILEEIENNHGLPKQKFSDFVRDLYNTDFPYECQTIKVGGISLKRRNDHRHDGNEISKLLTAVGVQNFIQLVSVLLLPKKVILVSSSISLISVAIEGLLKAIYPFQWQLPVITVIPSGMETYLDSPHPYIFGMLKTPNLDESIFKNIEDVLVVDLDRGQKILANNIPDTRKVPVIPEKLEKALSSALYLTPRNCTDAGPSEALMRLFVQLVGHYRNHLISRCDSYPNHLREFQREAFIKAPTLKSVRVFLEWFTDTPLFRQFIEDKMNHTTSKEGYMFDQRCAEYVEENASRKSTTLIRNIGDRIKDWAS